VERDEQVTLIAGPPDDAIVEAPTPDDLVVVFGDRPAEGGRVVRFAERRADRRDLLIATRCADTWRRSPWPAADALFGMRPAPDDAPVLLVHPDPEGRGQVAELLRSHDLPTLEADRLGLSDLQAAGTVLFLDSAVFPATAPAVCAAGRMLILPDVQPLFGLQEGIDCLVARGEGEVVELAHAVRASPRAFDAVRAMARLAAAPYRASDVYARLALDVSLGVGVDRVWRPPRS
jgi:hypothetical protein